MEKTVMESLDFLRESSFRSRFSLTHQDRLYIKTRGMETITKHASEFIRSRIAPAYPKNDGKQTPMRGHPVFIAQYATATCCRGCIKKWHRIPKRRALSDNELRFMVELIMAYIIEQVH